MALIAGALTTFETVRGRLGLTGSERQGTIEALINAASQEMATLANRLFHFASVAAPAVELHPANGARDLWIERRPLISVTSVVELEPLGGAVKQTYLATEYYADLQMGLIHRPGGWADQRYITGVDAEPGEFAPRTIRVTYSGGWVTPYQAQVDVLLTRNLPEDIEEAVIAAAVSGSTRVGQDKDQSSATNVNVSRSWTNVVQRNLEVVASRYNRGV